MLAVRRSDERGHFDMGWLDTRHTFSFGGHCNLRFPGFSGLRDVILKESAVKIAARSPAQLLLFDLPVV
jgi:redox-sensitive bicupin YhaK (pirin superfamily)